MPVVDPAESAASGDAAALQRERLETLGRLTAGIAHELNNPIGYIASNLNTLERYAKVVAGLVDSVSDLLPPEARATWEKRLQTARWEYVRGDLPVLLAETRQGAEHLKHVVAELKNLSRQTATREQVDIDHCVHAAMVVLTYALKRSATVSLNLAAPRLLSLVRPQIVQLLINLVSNASEALGERTRTTNMIRITTREDDHSGVVLTVEDNGAGVPLSERERIFDPFYTTKSHGTGLGLAIVSRIVANHGGRIYCDASPELGGGRFVVELRSWIFEDKS